MVLAAQPGIRHSSALVPADAVLTPEGWLRDGAVRLDGGTIAAVDGDPVADLPEDAASIILPGIIDLHGDAFERAIEPRPGVAIPTELALAENDAWLVAAGITTAFVSATDSYEPGLRSRGTLRRLVDLLAGPEALWLACDTRLHIRHEVCLAHGQDELASWMEEGRVHLLSIADHLPEPGEARKLERYRAAVDRRLKLSGTELDALIRRAAADRAAGREQAAVLAETARRLGIPLASHDDASLGEVEEAACRGVSICEFPLAREVAERARELGLAVLLGAPNAVRGGSHLGLWSVAEAVGAGACDLLASDYHYPSLFHAPFLLAQRGLLPLAQAWRLVSDAPARAAGLANKGRLAAGCTADLLQVEVATRPRLSAAWVCGREVARFA